MVQQPKISEHFQKLYELGRKFFLNKASVEIEALASVLL